MIEYLSPVDLEKYFYPDPMRSAINSLENLYQDPHKIKIYLYPDAMFKPNGVPNGLTLKSYYEDTLLVPTILRDPGCGFLSFTLHLQNSIDPDWYLKIGPQLDQLLNKTDKIHLDITKKLFEKISIEDILYFGLSALDLPNTNKFANLSFTVDKNIVKPTHQELQVLKEDLFTLTNTVEIRKPLEILNKSLFHQYQLDLNDYFCFIHSGGHKFPMLLEDRYMTKICDYAYHHKIASLDMIHKGIFGIPVTSELGQEYYEWIKAAMNYALVSRYGIFYIVKDFLENALSADISMMNDRLHAGVLEEKENSKRIIKSSRGVQEIAKSNVENNQAIGVLAGNRETMAVLVASGDAVSQQGAMFSHGTNCQIINDFNYNNKFSNEDMQRILNLAKSAYYNTEPKFNDCIPLTFNLIAALDYFKASKLLKPVLSLSPLINIYGDVMKRVHKLI